MPAHPPVKKPEFRYNWPWDDRGRGVVSEDIERIKADARQAATMFDEAMRGRLASWLAEQGRK